MASHLCPGALVVSAVKGIEAQSLLRMSEVLSAELPSAGDVAVLSGPSFALELARGRPTAVVVASATASTVEHILVRSSAHRGCDSTAPPMSSGSRWAAR
ncbi:MAG: hypothetical protein R2712_04095 [Vicinamibacterales bacterium]